jgi:uncharacterized protein
MEKILQKITAELQVQVQQVKAAIELLDGGATVPFIARYRKEVTGALDDTQLRTLEERLRYLREMEDRRNAIISSIEEQGKMTPALQKEILAADTKTRLEDLYLPYKQKRRTKGQIAIEAGLEPLANSLYENPMLTPATEAENFISVDNGITDTKAALDGARYILMERFAENAELLGKLRSFLWENAELASVVVKDKEVEGAKFSDYFDRSEPLKTIPSHRALALFRGRKEGILSVNISTGEEAPNPSPCEAIVASSYNIKNLDRPADKWLGEVVRWTWRIKLYTHLETDLLGQIREAAETEAIRVFSTNLKDLLLLPPAGQKASIGLDPGLRTGVKVAVIDATGKVLDHCAIYPTPPQNKIEESIHVLAALAKKYNVELVAIGNGTGSRETDRFVGDLIKQHPALKLKKVMVNEAGASIYSASELAAKEFPDLDVTIRGAVSIARRLQDPLAELVKIDPKSIGVGQYQHDVSQTALARQLETVVEDCVNAVGVDLNTASVPLLASVSGLSRTIAENIVSYRDLNGAFSSRITLKQVPRLGDKTFEQAAGFLRVINGSNPLDASAVHPESYQVVENIAKDNDKKVAQIIGDREFLKKINAAKYANDNIGVITVSDIISELEKPGRDPRGEFTTADFADGVETMKDLKVGMILEGCVTNVTNFGAFVDIGVHQDGLVHISALADKFVKDPHEVVKAGEIVKVKVMEVDIERGRIALSRRLGDEARPDKPQQERVTNKQRNAVKPPAAPAVGAFGQALLSAKNKRQK